LFEALSGPSERSLSSDCNVRQRGDLAVTETFSRGPAPGSGENPHRYNKSMPEEKTSSSSFESSLEELERVVKQLEKGDLPLEQSLALFEIGMRLSAECKRQLEEAESRVEILMKKGSELVPVPFATDKIGK
jgi:exodeoxyribonuclease VII small subunit